MFDLVIFDCDGVLIDSEIISARMLVDALAGLGVTIDMDYVARHFLGRSYPTVMKVIRAEFGLTLTAEFEEQYRARLLAAFETELRVMPGVRAVLERLTPPPVVGPPSFAPSPTPVPWCVATSSSPRRAERSLQIAGLSDLTAGRVFTASMVARGKPAPDLFLHVAAHYGARHCLVIEDSLNGVRAGLAAGMEVWRFTGGSHLVAPLPEAPEDARAHLEFTDFAEFSALLARRA
ncbi:HAD family hydrolase [Rhodobacter sp. KR11]|uniref:HAD family hydrolase n=1 Tax=Rhodobacter sp. KR11 TaxID=2974588 RepID=UPI00222175F8|nr:HAD family hydrolase [Rhodobacter sp. KR11]MCW1919560.1 HAD family hydrolase [Rhodobacter sp. KR11]